MKDEGGWCVHNDIKGRKREKENCQKTASGPNGRASATVS